MIKKIIATLTAAVLSLTIVAVIVPTTFFAATGDVDINETNFPDTVLESM